MSELDPLLPAGHLQSVLHAVELERAWATVYPPRGAELAALEQTPLARVRVVVLGQDPYHGAGQADGLAFSVPKGVRAPPSLANLLKESRLETQSSLAKRDAVQASITSAASPPLRSIPPHSGVLAPWARQGVLLLNTVLTVRDGEPLSHRKLGWQLVTQSILRVVRARSQPVVFALFGRAAVEVCEPLALRPDLVVERAHPSPLSAHRGFLGTRPFAAINDALQRAQLEPIDWST